VGKNRLIAREVGELGPEEDKKQRKKRKEMIE